MQINALLQLRIIRLAIVPSIPCVSIGMSVRLPWRLRYAYSLQAALLCVDFIGGLVPISCTHLRHIPLHPNLHLSPHVAVWLLLRLHGLLHGRFPQLHGIWSAPRRRTASQSANHLAGMVKLRNLPAEMLNFREDCRLRK